LFEDMRRLVTSAQKKFMLWAKGRTQCFAHWHLT
jgi:hypothetical protein